MMRIPAFALVLIAAGFASTPAAAQDAYPSRTIRLIVPYPPGAVTDAMSRPVAAELGKVLGQTVIIENKPGAGTLVGTQALKQAPADGYTLIYQASSLVTNLYTMKQPGYTLADFTPVGMLGQGAFVLMTSMKHPFNTLQELVAYGKANPGKLNYSTTGPRHAGLDRLVPARHRWREWTGSRFRSRAAPRRCRR